MLRGVASMLLKHVERVRFDCIPGVAGVPAPPGERMRVLDLHDGTARDMTRADHPQDVGEGSPPGLRQ